MAVKVQLAHSRDLDEHVAHIQTQLCKSIRDGETRHLAVKIVSGAYDPAIDPRTGEEIEVVRAWGRDFLAPPGPICAPRDSRCEIERIWDFVVLNLRYVYDPADIDTFCTTREALVSAGEDCDGFTIVFGSLLMSIGFPVVARVISTRDDPKTWVHIYPMVGLPKDNPTMWIPLDATVNGVKPGWEYRDIAKTRDYQLNCRAHF